MKRIILSTFLMIVCLCGVLASLCSVNALGTLGDNETHNGLDSFTFNISKDKVGEGANKTEISTAKILDGENDITQTNQQEAWQAIYTKYRTLINFAYGAMMLTCLAGLVVSIIGLGASGGNPHKKQQSMMGILFAGLGIALLGSVGTWFMFAMNIL